MTAKRSPLTFADVLAREAETGRSYELIDGQIIEKTGGSFEHGQTQGLTAAWALTHFGRRGGPPDQPTGWHFATEVDVALNPARIVIPDIAGWRRARVARAELVPRPVRIIPDWACEILSPSNRRNDIVVKAAIYRDARVAHYWILDPERRSLVVYRGSEQGYLLAAAGEAGDTLRPEPFDLEVRVGDLFADDET